MMTGRGEKVHYLVIYFLPLIASLWMALAEGPGLCC
jgi:hypothetical protein